MAIKNINEKEFGQMMQKVEHVANDVREIKELLLIQNGRVRKAEEKIIVMGEWQKWVALIAGVIGAALSEVGAAFAAVLFK